MGLGVGYGATAATAGDALRRDGCGAPHHESPAWLSSMARFASDFASDARWLWLVRASQLERAITGRPSNGC